METTSPQFEIRTTDHARFAIYNAETDDLLVNGWGKTISWGTEEEAQEYVDSIVFDISEGARCYVCAGGYEYRHGEAYMELPDAPMTAHDRCRRTPSEAIAARRAKEKR